MLNMDQHELKNLKLTDSKGDTLSFDSWEISEILNIRTHSVCQQEKQGKDFRLLCLDPGSFEDWKLSPDYRRMTCQDSFLNYDTGDTKTDIPLCYNSPSTTQGGAYRHLFI